MKRVTEPSFCKARQTILHHGEVYLKCFNHNFCNGITQYPSSSDFELYKFYIAAPLAVTPPPPTTQTGKRNANGAVDLLSAEDEEDVDDEKADKTDDDRVLLRNDANSLSLTASSASSASSSPDTSTLSSSSGSSSSSSSSSNSSIAPINTGAKNDTWIPREHMEPADCFNTRAFAERRLASRFDCSNRCSFDPVQFGFNATMRRVQSHSFNSAVHTLHRDGRVHLKCPNHSVCGGVCPLPTSLDHVLYHSYCCKNHSDAHIVSPYSDENLEPIPSSLSTILAAEANPLIVSSSVIDPIATQPVKTSCRVQRIAHRLLRQHRRSVSQKSGKRSAVGLTTSDAEESHEAHKKLRL